MDNKKNFRKEFFDSFNVYIKEFNELKDKKSDKLINWSVRCSGSYFYKLEYINQYQLSQDPEIKSLCDQFDRTILSFIKNHLQVKKETDPVLKERFERDYRIAISFTKDSGIYYENDYYDLDYDLFATNGFHYYLKAFKTLNCYQELEWDKKEKEFWSSEGSLKQLILKYAQNYYADTSSPWFPEHLSWWPKEFWWNDVLAYGAVVFRNKKFEDVVLYPENLNKVEILKLGK